MTTATLEFSFLTSGPIFRLEVPADLPDVPFLSSAIVSGIGGREFGFTPSPHDLELAEGMARDGELQRTLADRDGRLVELYRRIEPPVTWWLRWQLQGGSLTTHLREEDGAGQADVVVRSLSVVEDGPTPFLLLFSPLRSMVSGFPGYQEVAWTQNDAVPRVVTLMRPGYLGPGAVVSNTSGGVAQLRAGTDFGLEVQVQTGRGLVDAQSILSTVLGTLVEG